MIRPYLLSLIMIWLLLLMLIWLLSLMLWLGRTCITKKYMIAIIAICPVSRYQTKNLHHTSWYLTMWCNATLAKIFEMCTSCPVSRYQTKSCFTLLRIDILPYDEMLQLMNTWNVILYLIDLSINLCLSYMNLLNVILRMISDLSNAWFVFTT